MSDRLSSCSSDSGHCLWIEGGWGVVVRLVVGLGGRVCGSDADYWVLFSESEAGRVIHSLV